MGVLKLRASWTACALRGFAVALTAPGALVGLVFRPDLTLVHTFALDKEPARLSRLREDAPCASLEPTRRSPGSGAEGEPAATAGVGAWSACPGSTNCT